MRIAVTSPSFSNHPDLIHEIQSNFSHVTLNQNGAKFSQNELINYLKNADAAIVGLDKITKEVIDQLPNLKIISKYGVGLDNIDLNYCKEKQIAIGWTGGVNKTSVAEMVLGNVISLCRNLYQTSLLLSSGIWEKNGGVQLTGKTFGIIGIGHIGKELIRLLKPFNCTILVNDIIQQEKYYTENNLIESTKEEIFKNSDIISIHTPLNEDTEFMIQESTLSLMKENVIIINSARGGIIKESDLKKALISNPKMAAAIDVYEQEPPEDIELLSLPNLICTPHIGGNAKEAVYAMGMSAIKHIKEFYKL